MENRFNLRNQIIEFLTASTCHGLPNILKSKIITIRIVWIILTLTSTCICAVFIYKSVNDYLNYEVVTSIDVIHETKSEFPTVSFCSTSGFNQSLERLINFCTLNNQKCSLDDFEQFHDPIYFTCYRYNSAKKSPVFHSFNGIFFGLKINLYFELNDGNDFGDIVILIHNHTQPPINLFNKGYYASTGTFIMFEIERLYDFKLDKPFNDCFKNIDDFSLNKTLINHFKNVSINYSQKECLELCSNLLVKERSNCNCTSELNQVINNCVYVWNKINLQPIDPQIVDCSSKYFYNLLNTTYNEECSNYCPLECDSITYSFTIYTENLPTTGLISNKSKSLYKLYNFTTYDEANRKFLSFLVYYKDSQYTKITQQAKMQLVDLVSNIGGILGLFLGISFLSLFELFEILFYIIHYFSLNKFNRKNNK